MAGPRRTSPARASWSTRCIPAAGVGRALGEYVLAWAREAGYRAMQFNAVVETNTRAVALWRSLGFEVMTTLPEAFEHPSEGYVGLHIMWRAL
ncbi:MAG TPA: GNAT family N-acetyltransferase [Solirubrobacter sp.]